MSYGWTIGPLLLLVVVGAVQLKKLFSLCLGQLLGKVAPGRLSSYVILPKIERSRGEELLERSFISSVTVWPQ